MSIYLHLKKLYLISLIFIIIITISRIFVDYQFKYNFLNLSLSALFLFICFSLLFTFFKFNESNNDYPIFPLIIIYFTFSYGFSLEFINTYLLETSDSSQFNITKIFIMLNVGIFIFSLGYYIPKNFLKRKSYLKYCTLDNNKQLLLFALSLIFINLINKLTNYIPNSINQVIMPTTSIGCAIVFYIIISTKNIFRYFLLCPVIILIIFEISSSSYVYPGTILLQYLIIYFMLKKKLPILHFLIFLIFFIFLHSYKYDFRYYLKQEKNINYIKKTEILFDVYAKTSNYDKTIHVNRDRTADNLWRLAHPFSSLIIITKKTPNEIPYWKGDTYKILLSKFVPRIFWKAKPSDDIANLAGRRYLVLSQNDFNTSWNLPIFNEAYANFGITGVFIIMFVLGIFVRLLTNLTSIMNFKSIETYIGIYICSKTFFWEPHLSLVYGGILYVIVFLYLISIIYKLIIQKVEFMK